jgi:hypothetical protein
MGVNADWQETYTTPEYANVRYPSSAKKAICGWAYVRTIDQEYVDRLSGEILVQVKRDQAWVRYDGVLPKPYEQDFPPEDLGREWEDEDPNY